MKRVAFTLIELLVVLAVIALLISLLLPSLGRARDTASGASCQSAMRQVTTAAIAFTVDHDGRLPAAGNLGSGPPAAPTVHASWFFLLRHYLTSPVETIARCPLDRSPHWETVEPGSGLLRATSYASNFYVSGRLPGYEEYVWLHRLKQPSNTIFAAELAEAGDYAASDHIHAELWLADPAGRSRQQVALKRHHGSANWSHLDAHVEMLEREAVYAVNPASTVGNIIWDANRFHPGIAK